MKRAWVILLLTVGIMLPQIAQAKKVKIKGDKTIVFNYEKDSSDLSRKETVQLVRDFYVFQKAITTNNYEGYLGALSPITVKRWPADKLERKYKKMVGYEVPFLGAIQIYSIRKYGQKKRTGEESEVYQCTIKLNNAHQILKRSGFDPLRKTTIKNPENYYAVLLVKYGENYKVVIKQ